MAGAGEDCVAGGWDEVCVTANAHTPAASNKTVVHRMSEFVKVSLVKMPLI
jgi:hypothetical protein